MKIRWGRSLMFEDYGYIFGHVDNREVITICVDFDKNFMWCKICGLKGLDIKVKLEEKKMTVDEVKKYMEMNYSDFISDLIQLHQKHFEQLTPKEKMKKMLDDLDRNEESLKRKLDKDINAINNKRQEVADHIALLNKHNLI